MMAMRLETIALCALLAAFMWLAHGIDVRAAWCETTLEVCPHG